MCWVKGRSAAEVSVGAPGDTLLGMQFRTVVAAVLAAATVSLAAACGDGPDEPDPTIARTTAPTPTTAAATKPPEGSPVTLKDPTTTPSGLKYTDQVVGTGKQPSSASSVVVHYTGRLASNGQKFDSSVDRGQPAEFKMTNVIAGFSEALSTMKEGGKRTALIPGNLGYGSRGNPGAGIPPNADLIFEIELITVK